MTQEERIEALMHAPVKTRPTGWRRVLAIIRAVCDVVAIVALGVGLTVALVGATEASCLNSRLASRNDTTQKQGAAITEFVTAFYALFALPPSLTPLEKIDAENVLKEHVHHSLTVLGDVNTYRAVHPLGNC